MINPIADAIKASIKPGTQVYLIMQGEMGATIFFSSAAWLRVAGETRARVAPPDPAHLHIGLGINNAKLCGCILVGIVDHREYLAKFPAAFEQVKSEFDVSAIQQLFKGVDFIGISAYIPMPVPQFQVCELEGLMTDLDTEFSFYGLTLKELSAQGKELHWIEFGVGGGTSPTGDKKATTAEEAAYTPFFGISGPYRRAMDPFLLYDLSQPSPVRDYARFFYNQTAAYLRQGGCQYKIDAAYVWNLESWDVQALYPISTTAEGSYRDPEIAGLIAQHNAAARGGG